MDDMKSFLASHPKYVVLKGGGSTVLAENGDSCRLSGGFVCIYTPPDATTRLRQQRLHFATLHDDALSDAQHLAAALKGLCTWNLPQQGDYRLHHYTPVSADGPTMLRLLRGIVAKCDEEMARIDRELHSLLPAHLRSQPTIARQTIMGDF